MLAIFDKVQEIDVFEGSCRTVIYTHTHFSVCQTALKIKDIAQGLPIIEGLLSVAHDNEMNWDNTLHLHCENAVNSG